MSRSTAQFNLRPGVGGVPPIVRIAPRVVNFGCTISPDDATTVNVRGGKVRWIVPDGTDTVCSFTSISNASVSGLVNGDIIYVELTFDRGWNFQTYTDTNTDDVTVYERNYGNYVLTLQKAASISDPVVNSWIGELAVYRVTAGVPSLEIAHEGDFHITLPHFQIPTP